MKANNLKGWFDVRQYNEKKPREQWKIKGDDETIGFGFTTEDPGDFAEFARQYTNKDGKTAYRVNFKIGGRCQWFAANGERIDRPTNSELEADRWLVNLDYTALHGKEGTKEARGYWVNAIQAVKVQRYEFAPMEVATAPFPAVETAAADTAPQAADTASQAAETIEDDPFA